MDRSTIRRFAGVWRVPEELDRTDDVAELVVAPTRRRGQGARKGRGSTLD